MHDEDIATLVEAALLKYPTSYGFSSDQILSKVRLYRASAGNPNTQAVARDVHDFWLGHELSGDLKEITPEHLPFNFLPRERQVVEHLIRGIVVSLLPLWKETPPPKDEAPTGETLDEQTSV